MSKRTVYLVSAVNVMQLLSRTVGGVFTFCMTPQYQSLSPPGAHTRVPMIERLAKRLPVDIL